MDERLKEILSRALSFERANPYGLGWRLDDVGAWWADVKKLMMMGLVRRGYTSSNAKHFNIAVPYNKIEEIIREQEKPEPGTRVQIPEDIFDTIVGREDIKWFLMRSLGSERHHVMLVGPPSTAKTLFLLEIARIGGAEYVLGHSTTSPGLHDQFFDSEPRYVVIDEVERMRGRDQAALLSLMETGMVKDTKSGKRREIELLTNVYAACNRPGKLPSEIRSRFEELHIPEYTEEEFLEVVTLTLERREDTEGDLAGYIAARTLELGGDVRTAIRLARLSKSRGDVDKAVEIMKKYGGT